MVASSWWHHGDGSAVVASSWWCCCSGSAGVRVSRQPWRWQEGRFRVPVALHPKGASCPGRTNEVSVPRLQEGTAEQHQVTITVQLLGTLHLLCPSRLGARHVHPRPSSWGWDPPLCQPFLVPLPWFLSVSVLNPSSHLAPAGGNHPRTGMRPQTKTRLPRSLGNRHIFSQ